VILNISGVGATFQHRRKLDTYWAAARRARCAPPPARALDLFLLLESRRVDPGMVVHRRLRGPSRCCRLESWADRRASTSKRHRRRIPASPCGGRHPTCLKHLRYGRKGSRPGFRSRPIRHTTVNSRASRGRDSRASPLSFCCERFSRPFELIRRRSNCAKVASNCDGLTLWRRRVYCTVQRDEHPVPSAFAPAIIVMSAHDRLKRSIFGRKSTQSLPHAMRRSQP